MFEFWSLVASPNHNGCMLWLGGCNGDGYGYYKSQRAHRLAYTLAYGPPKHFVLHRCGVRKCCNPEHLYDGTHADNMQDMTEHGTHDGHRRVGQQHPLSKLTDMEADSIRKSTDKGVVLAKRYNISPALVSSIRKGTRRCQNS